MMSMLWPSRFGPRLPSMISAHQPDDKQTEQRRSDAGDAQLIVRRGEHAFHHVLGATWKGGEHKSFEGEEQAKRHDEIGHRRARVWRAALLVGGARRICS